MLFNSEKKNNLVPDTVIYRHEKLCTQKCNESMTFCFTLKEIKKLYA